MIIILRCHYVNTIGFHLVCEIDIERLKSSSIESFIHNYGSHIWVSPGHSYMGLVHGSRRSNRNVTRILLLFARNHIHNRKYPL